MLECQGIVEGEAQKRGIEILASLRQGDVGVAAAYGVLLMLLSALVFALGNERKVVTR